MNDEKDKKFDYLQKKFDELEALDIMSNENGGSSTGIHRQSITISSASLDQNFPILFRKLP